MKLKFWEKKSKSTLAKETVVKAVYWVIGKPEPKHWWELKR
jgi:hypothetical protein